LGKTPPGLGRKRNELLKQRGGVSNAPAVDPLWVMNYRMTTRKKTETCWGKREQEGGGVWGNSCAVCVLGEAIGV